MKICDLQLLKEPYKYTRIYNLLEDTARWDTMIGIMLRNVY